VVPKTNIHRWTSLQKYVFDNFKNIAVI